MRRWVFTAIILLGSFYPAWAQNPTGQEPSLLPKFPGHSHKGPVWKPVEGILGRSGEELGDGLRISFPRSDLNVLVNGFPVEPDLALTSWFVFEPLRKDRGNPGPDALMMGELVLLDQEAPRVMEGLSRDHLSVTAVHRDLLGESPGLLNIHVMGLGTGPDLAETLKDALSLTGTPLAPPRTVPTLQTEKSQTTVPGGKEPSKADWSRVEAILGKGQAAGKVYRLDFPRAGAVTVNGAEINPLMGLSTCVRMQMEKDRMAATGDFVLTPGEVEGVMKALAKNHILVTSVYDPLSEESPRLYALHFWAVGDPEAIAKGIKKALGLTSLSSP